MNVKKSIVYNFKFILKFYKVFNNELFIFFLKNSIIERVIHKSTATIINITKNIN